MASTDSFYFLLLHLYFNYEFQQQQTTHNGKNLTKQKKVFW